jgi:predicted HTH transcriptional regulator
MTKSINGVKGYQDLINHARPSYRCVAQALCKHQETTARELMDVTKISLSSIQSALADFKKMGFVHVCRWDRPDSNPRSLFAVYRRGGGKDASKPAPRYLEQYVSKKERAEEKQRAHKEQIQTWQELSKMLIPKRTPAEQQAVNRLYLNWISEGVYG